jgi:hypothetical protein
MNTLNTTKEEVSAEAIMWKHLGEAKLPIADYWQNKVLAAMEEYANTVLSSQKGEEAPLYKQFYDRIHGGRNELEWLQINKMEFADFVVRTFDYFEQQVNKKGE